MKNNSKSYRLRLLLDDIILHAISSDFEKDLIRNPDWRIESNIYIILYG